jgi:hypothetical protein
VEKGINAEDVYMNMTKDDINAYDYISPNYMVKLVSQIEDVLWDLIGNKPYTYVKHYIFRWHESINGPNYYSENFKVYYQNSDTNKIDLSETLHSMPNELVVKIAIDLGIDTPGFLPSIPEFRNELKNRNPNAYNCFERALKNVYENPQDSISLANSTLEGLIKTLIEDNLVNKVELNQKDTLYKQTHVLLKSLKIYPKEQQEIEEILKIGQGLLTISQNIESLRSTKTDAHGKRAHDYLVSDVSSATFIINSVTTVGLLLIGISDTIKAENDREILQKSEDIPF